MEIKNCVSELISNFETIEKFSADLWQKFELEVHIMRNGFVIIDRGTILSSKVYNDDDPLDVSSTIAITTPAHEALIIKSHGDFMRDKRTAVSEIVKSVDSIARITSIVDADLRSINARYIPALQYVIINTLDDKSVAAGRIIDFCDTRVENKPHLRYFNICKDRNVLDPRTNIYDLYELRGDTFRDVFDCDALNNALEELLEGVTHGDYRQISKQANASAQPCDDVKSALKHGHPDHVDLLLRVMDQYYKAVEWHAKVLNQTNSPVWLHLHI